MRPSVSLVADTICRTAEIGLAFAGAAGAGTFTITDAAALVALEGGVPMFLSSVRPMLASTVLGV
ncbi:hypothetical protein, partial [Corynebacterium sp. 805_CJEI]|uniref:hypothetical protein n=1 Tax=Corynebacterium sp. 805_CJEI TaxID=2715677 RepID=UPI000667F1C4